MWMLVPIALLFWLGAFIIREQLRLAREVTRVRDSMFAAIRRVDDHLDELGLVFSDLAAAPTQGQIDRAEMGLISLMDDLMRYQEAV